MQKNFKNQQGSLLIYLIIIIAIFIMVMFPVVLVFTGKMKLLRSSTEREKAMQIADAGINYYQWHLAHFTDDYKDGTTSSGPYVHDYIDYDTQETVGKFSLTITAPATGSTIVTVKSTGWTTQSPEIKRTVTARFGVASLAKYAFLSNENIWIGSNESVSGQMQSNNGIRFDGFGNAPIQSAKSTYSCPDTQGSPCPTTKNGVWGAASATVQSFWQFPVPAIDFSSLTSDFATMKGSAETAGIYLPPSNEKGYSLVFNSSGTVTVYKVTKLSSGYFFGIDTSKDPHNESTDYNNRTLQFTQTIPSNGIIFVEDNVWVEGTVNGRATVVAALLPHTPSTDKTIYIPKNIVYAEKDGTDALGLIAQNDIVVSYGAPTNLEIDAALISQYGAAQFFRYIGNIKNSITVYGTIMTYNMWTWTWVSGSTVTAGYKNTYSTYDTNLLFGPPPSFPLSSSGYQLLSWMSD